MKASSGSGLCPTLIVMGMSRGWGLGVGGVLGVCRCPKHVCCLHADFGEGNRETENRERRMKNCGDAHFQFSALGFPVLQLRGKPMSSALKRRLGGTIDGRKRGETPRSLLSKR